MPTKSKTTVTNPADAISELVEKRDLLREQRDLVASAPRAQAEASADVDRVVEQLAAGVDLPVCLAGPGASGVGELVHLLGRTDQQDYRPLTAAQMLGMGRTGLAGPGASPRPGTGVSGASQAHDHRDRLSELAKLDRGIAAVETELAEVWWSAVDAGLQLAVPPIDGGRLIGLAPV